MSKKQSIDHVTPTAAPGREKVLAYLAPGRGAGFIDRIRTKYFPHPTKGAVIRCDWDGDNGNHGTFEVLVSEDEWEKVGQLPPTGANVQLVSSYNAVTQMHVHRGPDNPGVRFAVKLVPIEWLVDLVIPDQHGVEVTLGQHYKYKGVTTAEAVDWVDSAADAQGNHGLVSDLVQGQDYEIWVKLWHPVDLDDTQLQDPVIRTGANIPTGPRQGERNEAFGKVHDLERRGAKIAAVRTAAPVASPCGCDGGDFDARTAIAALSRKIEAIVQTMSRTEHHAGQDRVRAAPAPDGVDHADWQRAMLALASTAPRKAGLYEILGGKEAISEDFPSCVCLGNASDWFCTGALIHPQVVLTAAHCGRDISRVLVDATRIPGIDGPTDGRIVRVEKVVRHPRYDRHAKVRNDITVIILAAPLKDASPIVLASDVELAGAAETILAGFGYNDPVAPVGFGRLREVEVNLGPIQVAGVDHTALGQHFGYDPATEFVAGRKGLGRDSCNGDSGGPAYIDLDDGTRLLAGLTSRATADAEVNCGDGGIYVRPYRYRHWIMEVASRAGIGIVL